MLNSSNVSLFMFTRLMSHHLLMENNAAPNPSDSGFWSDKRVCLVRDSKHIALRSFFSWVDTYRTVFAYILLLIVSDGRCGPFFSM